MTLSSPSFESWFPRGTALWFVNFMQQALYHPVYGYYTTSESIFGPGGDFITAPEMTPLFGYTLANACLKLLNQCESPLIFEFGAGTGRLCVDVLTALEQHSALPDQYVILEVSGRLKALQAQTIQAAVPHLYERVRWVSEWPAKPFQGVILANEVLDAMPIHRMKCVDNDILESKVYHTEAGELIERWEACEHPRLVERLRAYVPHSNSPYFTEINGMLEDWISQCFHLLEKGGMLVIDYGFPASEYYHPDRSMGTLMCHYRHHSHSNPFVNIGEQDITAHVDFTHLAEAADSVGWQVAWFTSQASFLLDNGLLQGLSDIKTNPQRFNATQAVQQLLSPSEMGELFKVMLLTKQCEPYHDGSIRYDQRGRL